MKSVVPMLHILCCRYGNAHVQAEVYGHKADGVWIWRLDGMTAVLGVNSMTAAMLVDLWEELRSNKDVHTLIAVNCSWSNAEDIGQPWQRCAACMLCIACVADLKA